MIIQKAFYLSCILFLAGCVKDQSVDLTFDDRAAILLHYAADTYLVPQANYSDPEKVYWPAAIARMTLYGEKDSAANSWIEKFSNKSPYHFILVGMARLMPMYPGSLAIQEYKLKYLRNVKERTDSYNAWTCEGTENHINMSRTSGYLYAEMMESFRDDFPEATARKEQMKDWISYFSKKIYTVGTGEFNASTYGVYNIIGWLNLYDFAQDREVRQSARAVLDYYACELALHYTQGMTSGPESRGAPQEIACRAETDYLSWLWFGDAPGPINASFFKNDTYKPPLQAVHAATSSYRPPEQTVFLARKKFSEPIYHVNSKPAYLLNDPGYIRHFQYSDPDFTLGSACYPYGAFGSSAYKNVTWKLISRVDYDSSANPKMVTGGGMYYDDLEGKMRNPWLQVVQYKNVLVQLNKTPQNAPQIQQKMEEIFSKWSELWERDFSVRFSPGDEKITHVGNPVKFQSGGRTGKEGNGCYISYPDKTPLVITNDVAFTDLGKTFLAIRAVSQKAPHQEFEKYLTDMAPVGNLCGLILEAHPARNFENLESFITSYLENSELVNNPSNEKDEIIYISINQDTIEVHYQNEGGFTEPIYDWGFGPLEQQNIQTSPPYLQPEWPHGAGHGRLAKWSVNGISGNVRDTLSVYNGKSFSVKKGILIVSSETSEHRVDYSGELPIFSSTRK